MSSSASMKVRASRAPAGDEATAAAAEPQKKHHKHNHRKGRNAGRNGLDSQARQLEARLQASCQKGTILDDAGLSRSHGKSRHMAMGVPEMLDRLWSDPSVTSGAVSTYQDVPALRAAVKRTLSANARKVARWACDLYGSGDRKLRLDGAGDDGGKGGRGVGTPHGHEGPVVPVACDRDVVVLERSPESWLGFRILTAYPDAPRVEEAPGGPHDLRPQLHQSRGYHRARSAERTARDVLCSGEFPHLRIRCEGPVLEVSDARMPGKRVTADFSQGKPQLSAENADELLAEVRSALQSLRRSL